MWQINTKLRYAFKVGKNYLCTKNNPRMLQSSLQSCIQRVNALLFTVSVMYLEDPWNLDTLLTFENLDNFYWSDELCTLTHFKTKYDFLVVILLCIWIRSIKWTCQCDFRKYVDIIRKIVFELVRRNKSNFHS